MAITLATGSAFAIATTYGTAKNMTAITNAVQAVATLEASHGVVVGDYLEVTSGWDRLNSRIVRVAAVATNDVTFENIKTSDTSRYPAGTGTGSIRRITAWTALSQVTPSIDVSGGTQNFADVTTITDTIKKKIPTDREAVIINLGFFDDPSLSWYAEVQKVSEASSVAAFRMVTPNGSKIVANAYWSLLQVPTVEDGTLRGSITVSFSADVTRYAN